MRHPPSTTRERHELRAKDGRLVAVIDELYIHKPDAAQPLTIEMSCDVGGRAYRVRIYPAEPRTVIQRVA
jgi:hypothetical protein